MEVRLLSGGDEAALEAFLAPRADASMFLRSNARSAGLVDRGEPLQGTYVAALEAGELVGVGAHFWNGMLVFQAPDLEDLPAIAQTAVARSKREVKGLAGPRAQIEAARRALGFEGRVVSLDSREDLFALDLAEMRVPDDLASGRVECRRPLPAELDLVTRWRVDFSVEALGLSDGSELRAASRSEIARLDGEGAHWILLDRGRPVSYSAFNARLSDVVQVGGVWTPRELRGRGYGRAVVAGSLVDARREGVERAILFTGEENRSARAAYEALGFRVAGDYGLVIFA